MSDKLTGAKRLVIKIGSALLIDEDSDLRRDWMRALATDIVRLRDRGQEVVIVSSGAVALGAQALGTAGEKRRLQDNQAAAAVGQVRLAHAWQEVLADHDITVAQILLTLEDTETRRRYLNARDTVETLLSMGVVPVINENDTVATQELRYGDNDRLAARVAQMVSADCLIILSDVDGLHTKNPEADPDAQLVEIVDDINQNIVDMAGAPKKLSVGSGGMITKITAAKIAVASGCHVLLTNGTHDQPIARFEAGGRGTWFTAKENSVSQHKQWLAGTLTAAGKMFIDEGALAALQQGKSLLPAGVTSIEGDFQRGDTVVVIAPDGLERARGLAAYSSTEARKIMGHNSRDMEDILGYRGRGELIHRDNLVLH
ncbi:MAG: glutamate 5-kinase [Alphaproteobacteria bacterium]|nr:MAG: glutamate 5-kinase [Alphaproteobacteria bacterium]